jgi:hypothetical protein
VAKEGIFMQGVCSAELLFHSVPMRIEPPDSTQLRRIRSCRQRIPCQSRVAASPGMCLPCLKTPRQLEHEGSPTWHFPTRRSFGIESEKLTAIQLLGYGTAVELTTTIYILRRVVLQACMIPSALSLELCILMEGGQLKKRGD